MNGETAHARPRRLLSFGFPGINHILRRTVAKRCDRILFGNFGAFCEDYCNELSIWLRSIFNSNGLETLQLAERRTDVPFAAASRNAGHAGQKGHLTCHRRRGEGHEGHHHGYNFVFHFIHLDRQPEVADRTMIYESEGVL
jgi:hypothetical protein